MCELFGVSSSESISLQRKLEAFRLRGGIAANNRDGWGIAYWKDDRFRIEKEPIAAAESELFPSLISGMRTRLLVAHVRRANYPPVNTLANTHPFTHACCGKNWVFAHNGVVPDAVRFADEEGGRACHPAGQTDSEHAFCGLLREIARHFR